jgi:hypothetical protein
VRHRKRRLRNEKAKEQRRGEANSRKTSTDLLPELQQQNTTSR